MDEFCPILNRQTAVDETEFSHGSWLVVRCRETGFVFLANAPDYAQLESEFAWEKTTQEERRRRQADQPVVTRVSGVAKKAKAVISPGRNKMAALTAVATASVVPSSPIHLLDIGCGRGRVMVGIHQHLAEKGRQLIPFGVEVSKQLATESSELIKPLGGQIYASNALEAADDIDDASIHVITMSSFLEHERRPLTLLKRMRPILNDDGAVILKVPNFDCWNRRIRGGKWCGFRYPDHVNYFTPATLQTLAREAGYEVSRQTPLDRSPLSDNMYAVLKKRA